MLDKGLVPKIPAKYYRCSLSSVLRKIISEKEIKKPDVPEYQNGNPNVDIYGENYTILEKEKPDFTRVPRLGIAPFVSENSPQVCADAKEPVEFQPFVFLEKCTDPKIIPDKEKLESIYTKFDEAVWEKLTPIIGDFSGTKIQNFRLFSA